MFLILFITLSFLNYFQGALGIRRLSGFVERCPFNESEWKERATHMFCQETDTYHCLLTEDEVSVKEQCLQRSLVLNDRICFGETDNPDSEKSENREGLSPTKTAEKSTDSDSGSVVIAVVILLIIVVMVVVLVIFYKMNLFGFRDKIRQLLISDAENGATPLGEQPLLQSDAENGATPLGEQPLLQSDAENGATPLGEQPLLQSGN
uniref:Uncharacterized protein n=1 Tax=Magallana gigas TaxID=29159 RepID=A0A8W8JXN9_MAGGI